MNSDSLKSIGIFDSGIGGLTVVKRIISTLSNESIIYFGDTARVPYGTKSNSTVIEYSIQDAKFLLNSNVKMIVAACNTASSVALDALRSEFDVPIIGMIEPGTKMALEYTQNNKIGVIGTYATTNNKAYSKELMKISNKIQVIEKPCPLFVPLAEEGWINHRATKLIAEEYLKELHDLNIDTLILGCTHYPILADIIQEVMGENVKLIDSGTAAARVVENELTRLKMKNTSSANGKHEYYVSDVQSKFKEIAERFLGQPVEKIKKIDLESFVGY